MPVPAVVVGTDGTSSGTAAVRWAAREAVRANRPLHIVHVVDRDWNNGPGEFSGADLEPARHLARAVVEQAAQQAAAVAPGVPAELLTPVGHAVSRLLALSGKAGLLVLGDRGRGGFAGLLLGSVSRRVTVHARCPVVVVRGRVAADEGPVAAGVDDSDFADTVLAAAFTAASERAAELLVVRSFVPALALHMGNIPATEVRTPEQDAVEQDRLATQLEPWRAKYPHVAVRTRLSHASAAAQLATASRRAQLVIVGRRGYGIVAGTLLGSTGVQLMHHADCPVMIVRHQPG
jgi:nucleotide-binding universal stress UspA family protein